MKVWIQKHTLGIICIVNSKVVFFLPLNVLYIGIYIQNQCHHAPYSRTLQELLCTNPFLCPRKYVHVTKICALINAILQLLFFFKKSNKQQQKDFKKPYIVIRRQNIVMSLYQYEDDIRKGFFYYYLFGFCYVIARNFKYLKSSRS